MEDTYIEDTVLFFLFFVVILHLLAFILYFNVIKPFAEARRYIKMEMRRSDSEEYKYWKRELKKLYMHYIPFIGLFIK